MSKSDEQVVNYRRLLWLSVGVSVVVMAVMLYLQRRDRSTIPARAATTATAPATMAASAPCPAAVTQDVVAASAKAPAEAPATAATAVAPAAPATAPAATAAAASAPGEDTWGNDCYEPHSVTLGRFGPDSHYKMQVRLENNGAAISWVKLADYFLTVQDTRRHDKNPATYEEALAARQDSLKGHYEILGPVGSQQVLLPLETQYIRFPRQAIKINLSGPRWQAGEVRSTAEGDSVAFTSVVTHNGQPFVTITKTYTLPKNSYSLQIRLDVANHTAAPVEFKISQLGPLGMPREGLQADNRSLVWARMTSAVKATITPIAKADKRPLGLAGAETIGHGDDPEPVLWVGDTNKFFASVLYVRPENPESLPAPTAKTRFFDAIDLDLAKARVYVTGEEFGPLVAQPQGAPGSTVKLDMDLFAGPKKLEVLQDGLYGRLRYEDMIESSYCSVAPLTHGMTWLLNKFSKLTFGNYGLAIMLLVVVVRVVLHPLTKKSQIAMSAMGKLQPEQAKLREKYKDDKAKLNEETMKLYKQTGATPILGCLPMLLQMPIWVALWTALSSSVALRHAAFLPVWITDLAAPDALVDFHRVVFTVPMVGEFTSFNLLPVLLAIAMMLQQKMTPTAASMDPAQARQQKNMMYFMTGFFLLMFYNQPSGLNLYIMTSTFAGVAEQMVIRKHIREKEEAAAAGESQVAVPGGHFRGGKGKKPKGPYYRS